MTQHYYSENPNIAHDEKSVIYEVMGMEFRCVTDAGVFSRDGLDMGTRIMLEALPEKYAEQMKNYNLKKVEITEDAVKKLILEYTREAGVRTMERVIEKLCRKSAKLLVEGKRSVKITDKTLPKYLGIPKYLQETVDKQDQIGVVTGLAWTSVGGETLNVEVNVMEGNGKLELTGSLGDVLQRQHILISVQMRMHSVFLRRFIKRQTFTFTFRRVLFLKMVLRQVLP